MGKLVLWYWVVFVGLLILGQLQRIELTPTIALYLHEVMLAVGLSGTIIAGVKTGRVKMWARKFFTLPAVRGFTVFLGFITASTLLNTVLFQNVPFISYLYLARLVLYAGLGFMLFSHAHEKYINSVVMLRGCIVLAAGIGVLGLLQYIFLPDTRFLFYLGWDDHYFRLISTLFDPNFTSAVLVVGIALLLSNSPLSAKPTRAILVLLILTLLLTYSRSGYAAFFVMAAATAICAKKPSMFLLVPAFLLGILLLPRPASEGTRLERTASITARAAATQQAVSQFTTLTLVSGRGWYAYSLDREQSLYPSHSSSPDSSYLLILLSGGIPGALAFLYFGKSMFTQLKHNPAHLAAFFGIGVHALFNNTLFFPWILLMAWGIMIASKKQVTAGNSR